jgi:hypothetical protein
MSSNSSNDSDDDQVTVRSVKEALRKRATLTKIAKYFFIFWGVCVIAGAATGIGLAHAGMNLEDAFEAALVISLLPVIAFAAVAFIMLLL